jgi:hypothetical protein
MKPTQARPPLWPASVNFEGCRTRPQAQAELRRWVQQLWADLRRVCETDLAIRGADPEAIDDLLARSLALEAQDVDAFLSAVLAHTTFPTEADSTDANEGGVR